MEEEIKSLEENETWTLDVPPKNKNVVSCKWVYITKINADGSLDKRKARLVARGFSQKEGVDFFETFSPVGRYETVRTVLAISLYLDLEMMQFDVKTAFLYGPLEDDIWMDQPEGFDDESGKMCHLKKGLYGLKQSPRAWNTRFHDSVSLLGLKRSEEDHCLYYSNDDTRGTILLTLYVDDGVLCTSRKETMDDILDNLSKEFKITSNQPRTYVGMEITGDRKKKTISLSQKGYISKILQRFGMQDCKSVICPAEPSLKLSKNMKGEEDMSRVPYREAVGVLNYLSVISRPDITYAVSQVSRFCDNPGFTHWSSVKRIMRYLKGTMNYEAVNGLSEEFRGLELVGFCDSDWAGEIDSRGSTGGFIFKLNGGPVSWSSRLQKTSALSSTEAEYMAMTEAMKEVLWFRPLVNWKKT